MATKDDWFKQNGHPVECKCPLCKVLEVTRLIYESNPVGQFFRGQTKSDVIKSMSEAASQTALTRKDMEASIKTLSGETVSGTWFEDCVKPLITPPKQKQWIEELFKDIKDTPPCQCSGFHPSLEDMDKEMYRIHFKINEEVYSIPISVRKAYGPCS